MRWRRRDRWDALGRGVRVTISICDRYEEMRVRQCAQASRKIGRRRASPDASQFTLWTVIRFNGFGLLAGRAGHRRCWCWVLPVLAVQSGGRSPAWLELRVQDRRPVQETGRQRG